MTLAPRPAGTVHPCAMNRIVLLIVASGFAVACEKEPEPAAKPIGLVGDPQPQVKEPPPHVPVGATGGAVSNELLVAGVIEAGEGVTVPPSGTLFVMGRLKREGAQGPLVLTRRVHPVKLPMEFSLTGADLMMQGVEVPDEFALSARLDQDGDAISRTPGDLTGEIATVKKGQKEVKLVLQNTITEAKPSAPVQ